MSITLVRALICVGALLVLVSVNYSIVGKERIRKNGEVIYLALAPVDPRSLMQGDYMALRFQLADAIEAARARGQARRGMARLRLDDRRIAALDADSGSGPQLRYRVRDRRIWLGTNAYFFEERTADRYATARYGEFRLDRHSGEAVLVGLRDEKLNAL